MNLDIESAQAQYEEDQMLVACMELAYESGRMRGLVDAEEERETEEWADAFHGAVFAKKYTMPCGQVVRHARSDNWKNDLIKNSREHLSRAITIYRQFQNPNAQ